MTKNINSLFTISEAYKDLNTSEKFLSSKDIIIHRISDFEQIKFNYNEKVTKYNEYIKKFPKNVLSKLLKFNEMQLFLNYDKNYSKPTALEKE